MRNIFIALTLLITSYNLSAQDFTLLPEGYFQCEGVDVMAFDDIYPGGHQGGVSIIMNGHRIATNGDIRLEATPGQWQPIPKQLTRKLGNNSITTTLCYPDSTAHLTGFNPIIYPDLHFNYKVNVVSKGKDIEISVDLDRPIPEEFIGKVGFNFEFYPGAVMGKPWIMDNETGIYPTQANSPVLSSPSNLEHCWDYRNEGKPEANLNHLLSDENSPIIADQIISLPYATGNTFTSCPNDPYNKVTVKSLSGELKLYDGRMNHNNGWFVLRSEIAKGKTKEAVKWVITPEVIKDWHYKPVIQTSQVGYHPQQPKKAIIELDRRDTLLVNAKLIRFDSCGEKEIATIKGDTWGKFLRYNYISVDFSNITEEGLYQIRYKESLSPIFRIAKNVYDRGIWQPVLEYFLPVQMCHMRVNEKYRVWHDLCHKDDALMAPAHSHIDGYNQEPNISSYQAGEPVPGVNVGGWHDAGDYDLRIESQSGECYILSLAYEEFNPQLDVTTIDQHKQITEIHLPDGKNDMLQQIEHGALSVISSYNALGRLYRGIICPNLRQYVMLGDASSMTDGIIGNEDDRWIFTEENPSRELQTSAHLAATSRTLAGFNDTLSTKALEIAKKLYQDTPTKSEKHKIDKAQAAVELLITTDEKQYADYLIDNSEIIAKHINTTAWFTARAEKIISKTYKTRKAKKFSKLFCDALKDKHINTSKQASETPYGIPYRPKIWGAGWDIQRFGFEHYFLVSAYPDIFNDAPVYNALNFILGCHPGSNQASFASGIGAESATVAYGVNRADWSFIPGGVISGTALIRPDFPELLDFPFLWQQTEYVMGGGSTNYMFLVLAVQKMLDESTQR